MDGAERDRTMCVCVGLFCDSPLSVSGAIWESIYRHRRVVTPNASRTEQRMRGCVGGVM